MRLIHKLVALYATAIVFGPVSPSLAAYPEKPIQIVVSTSPGGGADVTARLVVPELTRLLGQQIVVDNKPGASGMIAGGYVAKQPADGYTYLFDITSFAVNPSLYSQMTFDPVKDLVPVTQFVQAPNVLVVHPSVPVSNLHEFIEYAKSSNGQLAVASSGNGTSQHLTAEMFMARTGVKLVHVPYKGGGPALSDVMAGHVPAFFAFLSSAAPHIQAGRLKAIAITGSKRSPLLPDVPTVAESGISDLNGFEAYDFNGLYAPAGTPKDVIKKMQEAVASALKSEKARQQLESLGAEIIASTPEEFEQFIRAQMEQWGNVVKTAGVKVE